MSSRSLNGKELLYYRREITKLLQLAKKTKDKAQKRLLVDSIQMFRAEMTKRIDMSDNVDYTEVEDLL